MNKNNIFTSADILIPNQNKVDEPKVDLQKWSVVACDQYTSEPHYWESVKNFVGEDPSTLNLIFPEIYLETLDFNEKIASINSYMDKYINANLFTQYSDSLFYIERIARDGQVRQGIVGAVDLECYDYQKDLKLQVRATEGTVLDRIPPRVMIRKDAPLELPHIMVLIDDIDCNIIEKIADDLQNQTPVYDFDLMENSGSIKGYSLDQKTKQEVLDKLKNYSSEQAFTSRYNLPKGDYPVLSYAVGDGNHSLATAKKCYEDIKEKIGAEKALTHPARYALAELVNVHSKALEFEAIHRIVFKVNPVDVIAKLGEYFNITTDLTKQGQKLTYVINGKSTEIIIENPTLTLAVGSLTEFLDSYVKENGGVVDYIHGDDVTVELSKEPQSIGFILDSMEKSDLFRTVILDGALPRKTFSMGHAWDKRFYLELRKIK